MAVQVRADFYFFTTFSGSVSTASGELDVVGNIAVSGYLDVTSGANQGTYSLVSLTSPLITGGTPSVPSIRISDGTDLIFDNIVNAASDPFFDSNGLAFANNNTIGFNLWGNSPGYYSLFDVSGTPPGHEYIQDNGTATLAPVPEPASITLISVFAGLSILLRRSKVRTA